MNLATLKTRTIDLLTQIDSAYFKNAIDAIDKVSASNASGFADTYAKALVLNLASAVVVANKYYDDVKKPEHKLLLITLFDDGVDPRLSEDINAGKPVDESFYTTDQFEYCFEKTTTFLKAWEGKILPEAKQEKASHFSETADPTLFKNMIDVEMNDAKIVVLEKDTSIGTSELGSCVAICITGKNNKNETVVAIEHNINHKSIANNIDSLKEEMCADYDVAENTLTTHLIGGSICAFPTILDQIRPGLNVTDFILCTADEPNENETAVVISSDNPDKISYIINSPYPIIREQEEEEDSEEDDEELEDDEPNKKEDPKETHLKKMKINKSFSIFAPSESLPTDKESKQTEESKYTPGKRKRD